MSDGGYIYIRNWERFQHYRDRRPVWIKLYLDLLDDDEYLGLNLRQRGVLSGLWMLNAKRGNGRVRFSPNSLRTSIGVESKGDREHFERDLESLIQAGFIEVRASKALAESSIETETETETDSVKRHHERQAFEPPAPASNGSAAALGIGAIEQLVAEVGGDEKTAVTFRQIVANRGLSEYHVHRVRERVRSRNPKSPAGYAVGALRKIEVEG